MTKHLTWENSVEVRLEWPHLARHTSAKSKKQMPSISKWRFATWALLVALAFALPRASAGDAVLAKADAGALLPLVHSDWELQEKRLGRSPQSPEAIRAALQRGARLLANLRDKDSLGPLTAEHVELERLAARADASASFDEPARLELHCQVRTWTRQLALKNPLVTSQPVLFMERRRAVGYMLYEYLGWYYAHGNNPDNGARNPKVPTPKPGGGMYVLEQPGRTLQTRELVAGPAWPGHFVTLALSGTGQTVDLPQEGLALGRRWHARGCCLRARSGGHAGRGLREDGPKGASCTEVL